MAGSNTLGTMAVYHGQMSRADTAREIQGLNRGVERIHLRERKEQILAAGPGHREISGLSPEDVREEICELSIFFIEDAWPQLKALLASHQASLLRVDRDRGQFVPVTAADVLPPRPLGGTIDESRDPLTQLAVWTEVLLRAVGAFTERRQAARAFAGGEEAHRAAIYVRYCDLLDHLQPRETPTSHGIVNGLAGLQLTIALAEVVGAVYEQTLGQRIPRALYSQILFSPELLRLILAIASTRSQASNAILAELMGPSFATWRHSLLPRPDGSLPPRLRLRPACFFLQFSGSQAGEEASGGAATGPDIPSLQVRPEVLAAIRQQSEGWVTPGRTRQTMCPAFFADYGGAGNKGAVIQDFVGWLLSIVDQYYVGCLG